MFKKKNSKPEAKVEDPKTETFEEYVNSFKRWGNGEITIAEVAHSIVLLREAMKLGQLSTHFTVNEICFGYKRSKEQIEEELNRTIRYGDYNPEQIEKVKSGLEKYRYQYPLSDIQFKTLAEINELRKNDLQQRLFKAQDEQKKKVEEIENLAMQLGELE